MSAKVKVDRELKFAEELMKPVLSLINESGSIGAVHVCRGNWTKDESALLTGAYDKLSKFFVKVGAKMLNLEFSTPRAGDVGLLFKNNDLAEEITLGLGVINPRSDEVESVEEIVERVEKALEFLPPERIWLNPDCGFATFAQRPLNPYPVIQQKLTNMAEAAKILREKYAK